MQRKTFVVQPNKTPLSLQTFGTEKKNVKLLLCTYVVSKRRLTNYLRLWGRDEFLNFLELGELDEMSFEIKELGELSEVFVLIPPLM